MSTKKLPTRRPSCFQRFGWLLLIWSLSVLSLGLAAGLMKLLMRAIGMGS